MTDSYEIDESGTCTKCGHSPLHNRSCTNFCEEGLIDESEEYYFLPGTNLATCQECKGTTVEWWCPSCGANMSGQDTHSEEEYN